MIYNDGENRPGAQMRKHLAFAVALAAAFFTVSSLANHRSTARSIVGTVSGFHPEGIRIIGSGEQYDPRGFCLTVRSTTRLEGLDARPLDLGTSVAVVYRSVGERCPVADRIRVIERQP